MFQQVTLKKASTARRHHALLGTRRSLPAARATTKSSNDPSTMHSVRNVQGVKSASATFIAVQLNPHAKVRPARVHHSDRGICCSLVGFIALE